jgi:hypothetical protein
LRNFPLRVFVRFPNLINLHSLNPLFTEARSLLRSIHEEVNDV